MILFDSRDSGGLENCLLLEAKPRVTSNFPDPPNPSLLAYRGIILQNRISLSMHTPIISSSTINILLWHKRSINKIGVEIQAVTFINPY